MLVGAQLRPELLAARQLLAQGRQKLRAQHDKGSPGIQVSQALADLFDRVLIGLFAPTLTLWRDELPHGGKDQVALVALAGYGRRDVAPYSDIDLMVLHTPAVTAYIPTLASRITRDLSDLKVDFGQQVCTIGQACEIARGDARVWTALAEARLLTGSESLFQRFRTAFGHIARWRRGRLIDAIFAARAEQRSQFGETELVLQPNVKESGGGLRDLHLLRWIALARWGVADADDLQLHGRLSPTEARTLRAAQELLLRVRNELHFHAGKAVDTLDRGEQLRLADKHPFPEVPGLTPVEQFMRDYFLHTTQVSQIVRRFVTNARPGPRWAELAIPLFGRLVERDFRAGPTLIMHTRRGAAKLRTELVETLRLANLANAYDKRIAHRTREIIRTAAPALPEGLSPAAAEQFWQMLADPPRLGEMLRFLHETRILEKVVPPFAHARCLVQFNEYHHYTVDEHCIRAVERATALRQDRGPLGEAYAGIRHKAPLHLALLLHDVGKGLPGDHSELGRQIARETCTRLNRSPHDTEMVEFLVHKHLVMAHLAFWHDLSNPQVVLKFAVDVGSPELLRMLYVLTAADVSAVGPGVWNDWKASLLTSLYDLALDQLSGGGGANAQRLSERRRSVRELLGPRAAEPWFDRHIAALPSGYLFATTPRQVADDLLELSRLSHGEVLARGRWLAETATLEYTVSAYEDIVAGMFHRLTGALSSQGLEILSASINTLADGLALDRFVVMDNDYAGEPPAARIAAVQGALVAALKAPGAAGPVFRRVWPAHRRRVPSQLPTRVLIDDSTSQDQIIVTVFAADRLGLLHLITRTLFELGLSVQTAKIGTHLDQVADIFYVTDARGQKIEDQSRLAHIQTRLLREIEAFEQEGQHPGTAGS